MDGIYRSTIVIDATSAGKGRYTIPYQEYKTRRMSVAPKNKPNAHFDGEMINVVSSDISGTATGMMSITLTYSAVLEKFLRSIDTTTQVVIVTNSGKSVSLLLELPEFDKTGSSPVTVEFTILNELN